MIVYSVLMPPAPMAREYGPMKGHKDLKNPLSDVNDKDYKNPLYSSKVLLSSTSYHRDYYHSINTTSTLSFNTASYSFVYQSQPVLSLSYHFMMFSSPLTLIALAAGLLSSTVTADGWYEIRNKCKDTLYFQRVGQRGEFSTGWIEPHTTLYGSYGKDGDGISVKLNWHNSDFSHPYQFETTVRKESGQIFYDLSAVDGDPLINVSRGIWMSDNSGPSAWCTAWHEGCAYNYPTDDSKTHAGSLNGVVMMQIC